MICGFFKMFFLDVLRLFADQVNRLCEDNVICDMEEMRTTCDELEGSSLQTSLCNVCIVRSVLARSV